MQQCPGNVLHSDLIRKARAVFLARAFPRQSSLHFVFVFCHVMTSSEMSLSHPTQHINKGQKTSSRPVYASFNAIYNFVFFIWFDALPFVKHKPNVFVKVNFLHSFKFSSSYWPRRLHRKWCHRPVFCSPKPLLIHEDMKACDWSSVCLQCSSARSLTAARRSFLSHVISKMASH